MDIYARKDWDNAEALWKDALKRAESDEQTALGLLLARIALQLEDAGARAARRGEYGDRS